jgi:uncharacterized protein (UPF0264 family)
MTKLLISVRSSQEAEIACQSGADLIDIKEPARGSLGAADPATIVQIARQVAGRRPISAALGELAHGASAHPCLAGHVQYLKTGLAGCRDLADWTQHWQAHIERLPRGVVPVAVVYADWQTAAAPGPTVVLEQAVRLGCGAVLLDTFDKQRGPLTKLLDASEIATFINDVARRGLLSVVAGSLAMDHVAAIARLAPDYIAVRGAACTGGRTGSLDAKRVRTLAELLHRNHRGPTLATVPYAEDPCG